ncbi:MAG: TIGR00268 family protein [Candidatus Omnitrophica bacterium CG11_big_fil_rev_8_21_14_0_20_64_10]|nr:MAG: TIGR00268 family protein [Candidatus Omnitrophica bacterium CG11_big_fil_rev_8_21_14_0_20_64_10]
MSQRAVDPADRKLADLRRQLRRLGSVLITFSGGVDSTFLAKAAVEELGKRAVALIAVSPSLPTAELAAARALAARIGIDLREVDSRELEDPRYGANPVNRCYFCKSELFGIAARLARAEGFAAVLDGTQADDLGQARPGRQAAREWEIRSPLAEAGLTKEEIRRLSRRMGLPTWDKPEMACLASRIPTGTPVTVGRLVQVERCEAALKRLGFTQLRARHWEGAVRLEFDPAELSRLEDPALRERVETVCRAAGFSEVQVDPKGYRRS